MQPTTPEPRRKLILLQHTDPHDPYIPQIIEQQRLQGWYIHTKETLPLPSRNHCTTLTFITNPQLNAILQLQPPTSNLQLPK